MKVQFANARSVRNNACPLVRDKWLFTRTSKQSFSSYPSDKWKVTTRFYLSLYNAVINRQNLRNSRPGSDCHKVTAGFRSYAFEVDTSRATTDAKIGGGGAVSRYYVITTGHWQNQAQPFDVFLVLGSWKSNIIARKPYQGNHWLRQNILAFKCSSIVNDYASMTGKNWLPCIQTMCYWSVELENPGNITKT